MKVEEKNGRFFVTEAKGYRLKGECNRCGICCEALNCEFLDWEINNGERQANCKLHASNQKPVWCTLYPRDPGEKLHEGCSYYWEKING